MPTINDYKKKALNDAGYSGDISTAEWKWLKDICYPYVGAIPDMWRYALRQMGFSGSLIEAQSAMLKGLGYTDFSMNNKWYKYWRDTPLEGTTWWELGSALDLDFANSRGFNSADRDKTTPDSILTYTSPSPKLVYGDDGVLGYAPHNVLTYSEQFDNAAWVKTDTTVSADATVAPNGAATADLLTEGSAGTGQVGQTVSILSGIAFTVSLSLKRGNTDWLRVQVVNVGDFFRLWVNLNTGAIGTAAGGGSGVYISSSITAEAGGWYRVSITGTLPATSATLFVNTSSADNSSTRVSGGAYHPWGAQLNRGSSALTYIPTTTAAVYSLPIDHNPTTFAPLGVLIEEQRVNLLTYSEQFDNAAWVKTGLNTTATPPYINVAVSPDGTQSADFMIEDTANSQHNVRVSASMVATTTHTYSFFAKAAGRTNIVINRFNSAVVPSFSHTFTLSGSGTSSGGQITALDSGWYRCSGSFTTTGAGVGGFIIILDDGTGTTYTGDGTSGLYLWGAQLEAGAFPTSYIPTVASQVTRAADQVSILTSAFTTNVLAGTIVGEFYRSISDVLGCAVALQVAGDVNKLKIHDDTLNFKAMVRHSGGVTADMVMATANPVNTLFKVAFAAQANDAAVSLDGAAVVTDATVTMPNAPTELRIGAETASAAIWNGHIKRLTYFPTRRSNADLQVLST